MPRRKILLAYHDAWRTAAEDVEAAWRGWRAAPASGRADAAFAFAAALDREERAAAVYRVKWGA